MIFNNILHPLLYRLALYGWWVQNNYSHFRGHLCPKTCKILVAKPRNRKFFELWEPHSLCVICIPMYLSDSSPGKGNLNIHHLEPFIHFLPSSRGDQEVPLWHFLPLHFSWIMTMFFLLSKVNICVCSQWKFPEGR